MAPAFAQTKGDDFKTPPRQFLDPQGVDVAGGDWVRNDTYLSIGDGELAWTYHGHNPVLSGDFRGSIGDSCTNPPPIFSEPSCGDDPSTLVWVGQSATTFEPGAGGTYVNYSGSASTLVAVSGNFIYTDGDGTIYTFVPMTSGAATGSGIYLTTIKHPNGNIVTLNGQFTGTCTSGSTACEYNVMNAVSNTGYALKFDYTNKKVWAVNLSAHSCDASITCSDGYDGVITINPNASDADLTGTGLIHQITDPANSVWKYLIAPRYSYIDPVSDELVKGARTLWGFKDPTGLLIRTERQTRGGLTKMTIGSHGVPNFQYFTYAGQPTYAEPNDNYDNVTKDSNAATMYTAKMNTGNGIMDYYKDGLNRQTTYSTASYQYGYSALSGQPIGQYSRLISVTKPEGDYVTYTYDARGNVTSAVKTGKSSSGITLTFLANFPSTCTYAVTCNKPVSTQDAKGYQTDYTYSTTHGGVLTVTLPADQNNLRQRTYNTYTADTFGTNTLYRLTKTETCGLTSSELSLTACPTTRGGIDIRTLTSVTNIAYLSHTFLTATQTSTDGTGTPAATTTYAYDNIGNVISVDGPLTGTDDQTFKTYDAARRVIFEIGVDPDGTPQASCAINGTGSGCLKRAIVKHTYDAAGRETTTETGMGNATNGSDFTVTSFRRMTFDTAKRPVRTEEVQP